MERIIVENVRNNEIVCHPLLLLAGVVYSTRKDVVIAVKNSRVGLEKSTWPVVDGAFKLLVPLQPGENHMNLECASRCKNFRVTYRPTETRHFVRLVYIVCRGDCGRFQAPEDEDNSVASACRRLRLGARMIQTLTAEKIRDYLPERRSFKLEEDNVGEVVCNVFSSALTRRDVHAMSGEELWKHFAIELMQSDLNGGEECKFLAFLSATDYCGPSDTTDLPMSHSDVLNRTKGYVALGGGGLALFGTGCLHTWPQTLDEVKNRFSDVRKIDRSKLMDDSCNRGEYWACYSTGLGATLHELAHTFDLGHTKDGIMGLGFHDTFKVFTALPRGGGCNCFTSAEIKKREPNHYRVSFIHNIKWASANDNNHVRESHCNASNEGRTNLPCLKRETGPCCVCRLGASWTKSCAIMLYYHKWFNPCLMNGNISNPPTIIGNKVLSDVGIRIIEIRDSEGTLLAHKEYLEGDGEKAAVLVLPNSRISKSCTEVLVVVEDNEGNIVKNTVRVN